MESGGRIWNNMIMPPCWSSFSSSVLSSRTLFTTLGVTCNGRSDHQQVHVCITGWGHSQITDISEMAKRQLGDSN